MTSRPTMPFGSTLDWNRSTLTVTGQVLDRRLSDLEHLFADTDAWQAAVSAGDDIVYTVVSAPVPELPGELPHSITTIRPGHIAGERYFTKGHIHPVAEGEIYLGLEGHGGLLMYDGTEVRYLDMAPRTIGYIPPGWAHRSINVGTFPYSFLAVYPGAAGHDYNWVLEHGFGSRVFSTDHGTELRPY